MSQGRREKERSDVLNGLGELEAILAEAGHGRLFFSFY